MHTYVRAEKSLWTVGHYKFIDGIECWVPMMDFTSAEEAAAFVNYLNGGHGKIR